MDLSFVGFPRSYLLPIQFLLPALLSLLTFAMSLFHTLSYRLPIIAGRCRGAWFIPDACGEDRAVAFEPILPLLRHRGKTGAFAT
jgi:hypothetical protein